jgi:hypothetical protein
MEERPAGNRAPSWPTIRVLRAFGTAGEVIFVDTSPLTKHVFKRLPNVNHAYFRLRQQYRFW